MVPLTSTYGMPVEGSPPLPNEFGYFLARDPDVRKHAIQNMTGTSGRQRVAKECFDAYSIAVPTKNVALSPSHTVSNRKKDRTPVFPSTVLGWNVFNHHPYLLLYYY